MAHILALRGVRHSTLLIRRVLPCPTLYYRHGQRRSCVMGGAVAGPLVRI